MNTKKPIQVIVVDPTDTKKISIALSSKNYISFPKGNTYCVKLHTLHELPEILEETVIVISDYPDGKELNTLAQTHKAPKTICIGDYSRKDHIEIAGMHWCDTNFALTTRLPELINKIIATRG
ncbi:MAG: hypothetical protein WC606_05420 [Candidatus Absconditabacterales bacterium]|jgi:hypothetical protein